MNITDYKDLQEVKVLKGGTISDIQEGCTLEGTVTTIQFETKV